MTTVEFTGTDTTGYLDVGAVLTLYVAATDAPCQDVVTLDPHPDDADRLAAAIVEWAALARARQHRNSQPDLLVILI